MRRSNVLKVVLLVLAIALTIALLLGVGESRQLRISTTAPALPNEQEVTQAATTASATTTLIQPRYTGEDNQGRRWELTAAQAVQSGGVTSSTLNLTQVTAAWEDNADKNAAIHIRAQQGAYAMQAQLLQLDGDVQATSRGITVSTPQASANLASKQVSGTQGVTASGPLGGYMANLKAHQFQLDGATETLTLTGAVHVQLTKGK